MKMIPDLYCHILPRYDARRPRQGTEPRLPSATSATSKEGVDDYHSPVLRAAAAAAGLFVLVAGCTASTSPAGAINSQTASQGRTGPVISPPPVTPPTPPGDNLAAFACKDVSGGKAGTANVTAVRVGEQSGFDRFVLQFDSQVPVFTIKRQSKTAFTQGASGQTISVAGSAAVLITLHQTHQAGSYTGSTDIQHSDFGVLREAIVVQDFEGVVQWGVGLASPACIRAFTLSDPARLVIDFSTAT